MGAERAGAERKALAVGELLDRQVADAEGPDGFRIGLGHRRLQRREAPMRARGRGACNRACRPAAMLDIEKFHTPRTPLAFPRASSMPNTARTRRFSK
jgi:hypothetical protein